MPEYVMSDFYGILPGAPPAPPRPQAQGPDSVEHLQAMARKWPRAPRIQERLAAARHREIESRTPPTRRKDLLQLLRRAIQTATTEELRQMAAALHLL